MALIGSVFALVGRFAGRLLNSVISWATILLFGTVDSRRQSILSLVALGSLLWVALVVGVLLPYVGAFLIAAAPVPREVGESVVRIVMLVAAVMLPLVVGATLLWLLPPDRRPRGLGMIRVVARGYPLTLALAVTIVVLAVVAVSRKVTSLAKHWESSHVPVVVKPGRYDEVLASLDDVLGRAGFELSIVAAPRGLTAPLALLEWAAGAGLGALVPDRLMLLKAGDLEVLVYPSDVVISGTRPKVARARAAIATGLVRAPAYLTTTAEAQRVEDRIVETIRRPASGGEGDAAFRELDNQLASLVVPFDEWETLYRQRLQAERELAGGTPIVDDADAPPAPPKRGPSAIEWATGLLAILLLGADVALAVTERARGRR